jgi:hypothetical protein
MPAFRCLIRVLPLCLAAAGLLLTADAVGACTSNGGGAKALLRQVLSNNGLSDAGLHSPPIVRSLRVRHHLFRIVATDLNGDGHLDLVASEPTQGLIAWLNDGRGGFTLKRYRPFARRNLASGSPRFSTRSDPFVDDEALQETVPALGIDSDESQEVLALVAGTPVCRHARLSQSGGFSRHSPRGPPITI